MSTTSGAPPASIVLLGDSTLDNKMWVKKREPSVTEHLEGKIATRPLPGWTVCNLAVDGALVRAVSSQLRGLPAGVTHCVVSVGGNDGLCYLGEVENGDALGAPWRLARVLWEVLRGEFRTSYEMMLDQVCATGTHVAVCGLYTPCFHGRFALGGSLHRRLLRRIVVSVGVAALNFVVRSAAHHRHLPLIQLRDVCTSEWDFANPIEPSAQGGDKISENIVRVVQTHPFGEHRVYSTRAHSEPPYPYECTVRGEEKAQHSWRRDHDAGLDDARLNRSSRNAEFR